MYSRKLFSSRDDYAELHGPCGFPRFSYYFRAVLTVCSAWLILGCLTAVAVGTPAAAIPWSELGAKAGAEYSGDGLNIWATESGARLRCVFQRLEGEATPEGLWLTSTVSKDAADRFRLVARSVGRAGSPLAAADPLESGAHGVVRPTLTLPARGTVTVTDTL